MSELDSMIEKLKRRAKEDVSIFTKQEVAFLLDFVLQHNQSETQAISLNSSSVNQGGEYHG
jgi:hypothetical protein